MVRSRVVGPRVAPAPVVRSQVEAAEPTNPPREPAHRQEPQRWFYWRQEQRRYFRQRRPYPQGLHPAVTQPLRPQLVLPDCPVRLSWLSHREPLSRVAPRSHWKGSTRNHRQEVRRCLERPTAGSSRQWTVAGD